MAAGPSRDHARRRLLVRGPVHPFLPRSDRPNQCVVRTARARARQMREELGQAIVEFALVLPLLLVMILGVVLVADGLGFLS